MRPNFRHAAGLGKCVPHGAARFVREPLLRPLNAVAGRLSQRHERSRLSAAGAALVADGNPALVDSGPGVVLDPLVAGRLVFRAERFHATDHSRGRPRLREQARLTNGVPPTVGVVTFNEVQRDLIEDMLMDEAAKDTQFQVRYVAERNRVENEQDVGFFVKNLESVQGDERDVMIFSTTFGRDPQGQFRRFFGPINRQGGERRLNVAVTRPKKRNYLVTSMPLPEMSDVLAGGAPVGATVSGRDYLHAYMQYVKAVSNQDAEAQTQSLHVAGRLAASAGESRSAGKEDSLFEAEVRDALRALGYNIESQVGESGFRIDLAVVHQNPERGYILGIECDGKAYHSEWSARARDVWRQRILEHRGWKIHRVWSTNWWLDRGFEIKKLVARIKSLGGS